MNAYNNINFTWENKGILLGIIYYITNNYMYFIDKKIILNNSKFRDILSQLFFNLKFYKKGKGFNINIKNKDRCNLVINNINNIDKINTKTIYLLPWYDNSNPIIMYRHRSKYNYDVDKLKNSIKKFSKNKRGMRYGYNNYITDNCYNGINIWDSFMEYVILNHYVKLYNNINIYQIYKFISDYLINDICYHKTNIQMVPVQVPVPIEVPIEVPVEVPVEKTVTVEKIIDNKDKYIKLLNSLTNKLEKTNNFLYDIYSK